MYEDIDVNFAGSRESELLKVRSPAEGNIFSRSGRSGRSAVQAHMRRVGVGPQPFMICAVLANIVRRRLHRRQWVASRSHTLNEPAHTRPALIQPAFCTCDPLVGC